MKPSTLLLAAGVTLVLVIAKCCALPCNEGASYVKSEKKQQVAAAASAENSSSEESVKKNCGCGGQYESKSKKQSSKAAAIASQSSSENYEKKSVGASTSSEISEEDIIKIYSRQSSETEETYYKRLITKTKTIKKTEEYDRIFTVIRRKYPNLSLWYDVKYTDYVNKYYAHVYKRLSSESDEAYYYRIIKKEQFESEFEAARRVYVLSRVFPTLSLWYDEKYFKYTKSIYSIIYKKEEKETDEVYIKRLLAKDTVIDISPEIYTKRVFLIQEATCSSSVWYDEKYFQYTKSYYESYYKKVSSESSEVWLSRVLTPFPGESVEKSIKRVTLIKKATGGFGCFTTEVFQKVRSLQIKSLTEEYLCKVEKKFFASSSVVKKSKSSKSAAAAASSSSSEESTVIKS